MRVRCNGCDGEYETVLSDGMPYYHVCPGIPAVLVREKDGSTVLVPPGAEAGREILGERLLERPGHRDERPIVRVEGKSPEARRPGAGVTPIELPAPRLDPELVRQGAK